MCALTIIILIINVLFFLKMFRKSVLCTSFVFFFIVVVSVIRQCHNFLFQTYSYALCRKTEEKQTFIGSVVVLQ